jgi:anti-sigma factor RsiW
MDLIYGEMPGTQQAQLTEHLEKCAHCRETVGQWRATMKSLDQWQIAPKQSRPSLPQPLLNWGIAAALMLVVGFGAGRLVSPAAANPAALRSSLKQELLAELTQQLDHYKNTSDAKRDADDKVIFAAIARVDADRITDYTSLHKDLETMAVLTEQAFNRAHQQIVTLANSSQADVKANQ